MVEHDETIVRAVKALKEPVRIDPALDRRVMSEIERLPVPARQAPLVSRALAWLRRRRTFQLSPLGGLAMATGVVLVVLAGIRLAGPTSDAGTSQALAVPGSALIQFVLVAPGAESVAVVGDFNDWSVSATPLAREDGDGVWWVTIPLAPGRYRYAFLVDGSAWLRDPNAPALEDEFGRPNSVVTVGGV